MITRLPEEVWEQICSYLNYQDQFQLALTNKKSYDIVKMARSDQYLVIDHNQSVSPASSFLIHQVIKITIANNLSGLRLYQLLRHFRFVSVVDLTAIDINKVDANKLISYLRQIKRNFNLTVKENDSGKLKHIVDINGCNNIHVIEHRKRKYNAEEEEEQLERQQREPLPVSEIMKPLKESLSTYEKRLREFTLSPSSHVPFALAKLNVSKEYRSMMHAEGHGLEDLIDGLAIEDAIVMIGQQFVESVLFSNEGSYVLITQLEVYYKDREIDDASINNVQLVDNEYEKRPVVVVERKTAQKSAWYELKLYYKKYELLVTGAVHGRVDEETFDCFLGSSRAPNSLMQQSHWIVLAPKKSVPFERDIRLLQSFRNRASTFEWAFKSQNFIQRRFHTVNPLTYYQGRDVDYYSIASFILECGSKGRVTRTQAWKCRRMLYKMEFWVHLGLKQKPSPNEVLEAVKNQHKLCKMKRWMLELVFSPTPGTITNEELTVLYKNFLYQKLKAENQKRMKQLQ